MKSRNIIAVCLALITLSFVNGAPAYASDNYDSTIYDSDDYETAMEQDSTDIDAESFVSSETAGIGDLDISAPSAILIEKETGTVIFEKDADTRREPASITKVMTELLIIEALEANTIKLEDLVTVSAHAAGMGGSQVYLKEGEQMTVRDMLKAIVIASANDASSAMAEFLAGSEQAFAARMNSRAAELGMTNTHFTNASGLLSSTDHYSTARDISIMSRELIRHDFIKEYTKIWTDSLRGGKFGLANTNQLIRYFDGATGLKTGFTSKAGFCISATADRGGVEFIAVTLGDSSSKSRFESARALLTYAFAHYIPVPVSDKIIAPIEVELGAVSHIAPVIIGAGKILVPREAAGKITYVYEIPAVLKAPVNEGDIIGRILISAGGKLVGQADIAAGQSSAKLSFFEIFAKLISYIFTSPAAKRKAG